MTTLTSNDTSEVDVTLVEASSDERANLEMLADKVISELGPTPGENPGDLERIALLATGLPTRIVQSLIEYRHKPNVTALVFRGLPVNEHAAASTPQDYSNPICCQQAERVSALLLLFGSVLGDPVSYLTQQKGKMVLDLFPIRAHAHQQLGSSSTVNLEWHNEDAFHPLRADWIMLLGIRNHDRVPTTFCPIDRANISSETRAVLSEPHYTILPDESHTENFNRETTGIDADRWVSEAFAEIENMNSAPTPQPILSGDRDYPNIRIDRPLCQPSRMSEQHVHSRKLSERLMMQ